VHAAVLAAAIEVLFEDGFDALSIRGVAERAGVHESSIYRHWGTKATSSSTPCLAGWTGGSDSGHGSLRGDLLAALRAVMAFLTTHSGKI